MEVRALALDLSERQPVDVEQDVRPAVLLAFDDRELVDRNELVVGRVAPVDQPGAAASLDAIPVEVGIGDATQQEVVEVAVVEDDLRRGDGHGQLNHAPHRVLGQVGIQPGDCFAQAVQQHDV
jgi:hypothetical protein